MASPAPRDPDWDSQWLFTEEELLQTPSVLDGITPEQEREQRSKGCNFITQLGIQLKLPQLTLATASTYLHRFYMQNSLKHYHFYVYRPFPSTTPAPNNPPLPRKPQQRPSSSPQRSKKTCANSARS